MLSSFDMAVPVSDDFRASETAPRAFYAGFMDTFFGVDQSYHVYLCFSTDQDLADQIQDMFHACAAQDWDTAQTILQQMKPEFLADTQKCGEDPFYQDVIDTYDNFMDILNAALADDDNEDKVRKAMRFHKLAIRRNLNDIAPSWLQNDYYDAGGDLAKVAKIALKPWSNQQEPNFLL